MTSKPLTIGHLARAAGVNVETVRYYQRVGLVSEPPKPSEGFRRYPPETVGRLQFIKRAQRLGFTLKEIADLLEFGDGQCRDISARAEIKRDQVIDQIRDLEALKATLDDLIRRCHAGQSKPYCPMVKTLAGQDPKKA